MFETEDQKPECAQQNLEQIIDQKWWKVNQRRGNCFVVHAGSPAHALEVIKDAYDIDLSDSKKPSNISSLPEESQLRYDKEFADIVALSDLSVRQLNKIAKQRCLKQIENQEPINKMDNDQKRFSRPFSAVIRWLLD